VPPGQVGETPRLNKMMVSGRPGGLDL